MGITESTLRDSMDFTFPNSYAEFNLTWFLKHLKTWIYINGHEGSQAVVNIYENYSSEIEDLGYSYVQ